MSKKFELNVAKGSLIDRINKTVSVNTNCIIKKGEKGRYISFNATTDLDSYGVISGVKTVEIWLRTSGDTKILQDDGTDKIEISGGDITGTGLTQCYIDNVDTDAVTSNVWHQIIAEFSGGIDFATDLEINTTAGIDIVTIILDSEIYSATKRQNQYNAFLQSSNISSPLTLRQKVQHKAVEQQPELSLFHNYENGNSIDATSNNFDGTDTTINYGIEGARFNGSSSKIDAGDIGNIQAVTFLVKPKTTTEYLFQVDTAKYVYVNAGTVTYSGITEVATHVNGIATASVPTADKEYWITCVFTQVDALNFEIGTDGSNYLDGSIKFIKTQDSIKTLAEHKSEYNRYAKQVVFSENMTNQNADEITYTVGQFIGDWQVVSGSFKCSETATGKSIECVTDGDIKYNGINLSAYIDNGYISKMETVGLASDEGSTVDDATNVSFTDNVLTIANFITGDKLSNIKISKGVVV